MNPFLSELINGYYEMTGRPIASMTVTEYLQFASSAARNHLVSDIQAKENEIIREREQEAMVIPDDTKKPVTMMPVSVEKKESISRKSTAVNKENTALEMLRSISG